MGIKNIGELRNLNGDAITFAAVRAPPIRELNTPPTELTTDPAAENNEPATFLTGLRMPETAPPKPLPPPIIDLRRNAIMNDEACHLLFLFFTVIQKTYCCLHTCKCRQTFYPTSCRLSESSVKV
jgi:hypothetical protein